MEVGSAVGISLWLVPAGEACVRLSRVISDLSRAHGTPSFEPHVTLLGGLREPLEVVLTRSTSLARALRPFEARFGAAGISDEYFRCLFLVVEETPDLLEARVRARRLFGRAGDPPLLPHLSLVYGSLWRQEKERIAAGMGNLPRSASVDSLDVVRTDGPPESWQRLASLGLGGRQAG